MQKIFSLLIVSIFIAGPRLSFAQSKNETAIRKVLQMQEKAWNNGQLETFMQGYWKNDSLMYIGKSGITYGWQKTLDNYKRGYPDLSSMGKLTFSLIELKPLSPFYFFVAGKWRLQRVGGDIEGHFTLIFKKIKGQWLIISDHSS